ncbi:MAG: hypothetical protein ACRCVU_20255 [Flavobacterium sp.]
MSDWEHTWNTVKQTLANARSQNKDSAEIDITEWETSLLALVLDNLEFSGYNCKIIDKSFVYDYVVLQIKGVSND